MPGPVSIGGPQPIYDSNAAVLAELTGNFPPVKIIAGSGDPNENDSFIVFEAPVGSIFLRWDRVVSRTLYVREGYSWGGWVAK